MPDNMRMSLNKQNLFSVLQNIAGSVINRPYAKTSILYHISHKDNSGSGIGARGFFGCDWRKGAVSS